jgi:hypothetical protein
MSQCVCNNAKTWTPECTRWLTCPGTQDGAGLPLLSFVWGGSAADQGVYRSMIGSDAFFRNGAPASWKTLPQPPDGVQETTPFGAWASLPLGPVQ